MISCISNYVLSSTDGRWYVVSGQNFDVKEYVGENGPVVTCFGVDLLYPGLDLEIDAMAFKSNHQRMTLGPAGSKVHDGYFSDSIRASDEIWVGGQVAQSDAGEVMAPGDIREQARIVFQRLRDVLALSDACSTTSSR